MPLLPHRLRVFRAWSERFRELGISEELLEEALESKPAAVPLDALYETYRTMTWIIAEHAWCLAFLSGDPSWALKFNIDRNTKDEYGTSPAQFAATSGNAELVITIMEKFHFYKKHVDNANRNVAFYAGNLATAIILIEYFGLDPFHVDVQGRTIAYFMAQKGDSESLLKMMAHFGFDPMQVDFEGYTIAHLAASSGVAQCLIDVLAEYPELMTIKNKKGVSVKRVAVDQKLDWNVIVREARLQRNTKIINTYPARILAGENGWIKMLTQLRQSCIEHPNHDQAIYDKCCRFHIIRLQNQLKTVYVQSALKTLNLLAQEGVPEATMVLNNYHGAQALSQANKLKVTIHATPENLMNQPKLFILRRECLSQLQCAINHKIVSAHFQLGEFYHQGFAGKINLELLELAFAAYFQGAVLGDQAARHALAAATKSRVAKEEYLGYLYQGLYLNNKFNLEMAYALNPTNFCQFAIDNKLKFTSAQKTLLLTVAKENACNPAMQSQQINYIHSQLQQIASIPELMQFALILKESVANEEFNNIALEYADELTHPLYARAAMLCVVNRAILPALQTASLDSHKEALPAWLINECYSYMQAAKVISSNPLLGSFPVPPAEPPSYAEICSQRGHFLVKKIEGEFSDSSAVAGIDRLGI